MSVPVLGAIELPGQVLFSGAVTGLTYGILAVGVILVFRAGRFVNFAVAAMGALSAAVLARLVVNWDVSWFVAFPLCVVLGGLVGAAVELSVVRRLFEAPRVILLVATIGVAQVLLFVQAMLPELEFVRAFPAAIDGRWEIAGVIVQGPEVVALVVLPVVTLALAAFLRWTRQGTAIRAAAANADAARLAGISIKRMSTLVWVLAGVLSAVAVILAAPLTTTSADQVFVLGPALLLRVLAAALIGRMSSLALALVGGVAIGIGEAVLFFNASDQRGLLDVALLIVVLVSLLPLARRGGWREVQGAWSLAPRVRPVPAAIQASPWARQLPRAVALVVVLVALAPLVVLTRASDQFLFSRMLVYALVALSLTVLTGWAGQVSLGQFAFVGLGAMTTASLVLEGVGFLPALGAAALVGAGAAVVIGAPALRMPGLFLAVSTLAFAVATASWLLDRSIFVGERSGVNLPRTVVGPVSLEPQGTYYTLCLVSLALVILAVSRLRRSGFGRALIAVRDNEQATAAFGLSPARTKLSAFAVAGAIAGFAGGLLAGLLVTFEPARFSADESLLVVSIAVIGGLASIAGTVLGALWVVGLPALFDDSSEVALLTSGAGLLLLLLYFPGGLVQVAYRTRDALLAALADRLPEPAPPERVAAPVSGRLPVPRPVPDELADVLTTRGLTVRFGARTVVNDVDLHVGRGEVVGLIGANGAGKSTVMNAIGGFVPSRGVVEVLGHDLAGLAPARRARLGLGRSFQGAELFADLTVVETVMLALEPRVRVGLPSIIVGLPRARRAERAKRAEAEDIIVFLGLGRFADRFINELSTGTRRIVELAGVIASGARMICLDEPTAGIAQRESEAFGPLILRLRAELDASLLVIEHDMPLVMAMSDRVYCLEEGRLIAEGTPSEVRQDRRVVASYLGTDDRAIQRSGVRSPS